MYFLGIDPGANGAFCLLDEDGEILACERFKRDNDSGEVTPYTLKTQFEDMLKSEHWGYPIFAAIEHVRGRGGPGMQWSANNTFQFGRNLGWLEMLMANTYQVDEVKLIPPQTWQREMHKGITGNLKPKERSLKAVQHLSQSLFKGTPKSRVYHDGMVDAYLIAEYARRKYWRYY